MATPNNLPEQLTTFVGRERELGEVARLLDTKRLLTLTGAGGCGKSRLALEYARRVSDEYQDGVWLVELAALSDPALLPQAVASVLGLREEQDVPLETTLAKKLRPLHLLLILDNCEHLVSACADLAARLLSSTPALKILATSRQALGIMGEVDWKVPSLTTPDASLKWDSSSLGKLAGYEAVQLFIDRARLKSQNFAITGESAQAVAQICSRLDGIPLAIELAAARMKVLSAGQIVARLDERLKLLSDRSASSIPRRQTLRAAIDWGYDLLAETERALLRRLSVFSGGCSLEAVEAVCDSTIDEYDIIDLISHLVDKSLVIAEERDGEVRYRLLETIRQYASEKLQASGEAADLQARHCRWYLRLAQESKLALLSEVQPMWLAHLEAEHDNLRAALLYCRENEVATEEGLQLAGALSWFWYFRGYVSEARGWLESMLARPGAADYPAAYAQAIGAAGVMAYLQSDYPSAHDWLEESAALALQTGDRDIRAFALAFLGRVAFHEDNPDAHLYIEESLAIFRETGNNWGLALALDFLGNVIQQGSRQEEIAGLHNESLELFRQMGNRWGVALELSTFGRLAMEQGDLTAARRQLEEALAIQRSIGDKWSVAWLLNKLGDLAQYVDNYDEASTYYEDSLALFRTLGDAAGTASALHMLGVVRLHNAKYDEARDLLKESLILYDRLVDVHAQALALARLATVAIEQGDSEEARTVSAQGLKIALLSEDPAYLSTCLAVHARIADHTGRPERAAALLSAADALQRSSSGRSRGNPWFPQGEQEYRSRLSEEIKAQLGEAAFADSWRKGQEIAAASPERIVSALADFDMPFDMAADARVSTKPRGIHDDPDELTDRELDVLRLVAEGYTDAQLAEQLVISIRTVQAHLRSIYSKLRVTTRTGATRHALDNHLI
jgi:non-specific serine/threonine protein kinase